MADSTGGQTAKKAAPAAKKAAATPPKDGVTESNEAAATAAGTGSGAGSNGAPAAKAPSSGGSSSGANTSVGGSPNAADARVPSDKDIKAANKPGNAPADYIPNPDSVPALSASHAGPMSGGDASRRDEFVAASGPLEAPTDRAMQTYPAKGYGLSSTDDTYASSGGRTVSGEQFDSLVGEDGKAISADNLFEAVEGRGFVVARQRTFEQFFYPNTVERAKRLLFVAGQKIPVAEAARIKATLV